MEKLKQSFLKKTFLMEYGIFNLLLASSGVLYMKEAQIITLINLRLLSFRFMPVYASSMDPNNKEVLKLFKEQQIKKLQNQIIVLPSVFALLYFNYQHGVAEVYNCLYLLTTGGLNFQMLSQYIVLNLFTKLIFINYVKITPEFICANIGYIVISYCIHNQTQLQHMELTQIVEKEQDFKEYLINIQQPFCLVDHMQRIIFSSKHFKELFHYSTGQRLARNSQIEDLIKDKYLPKFQDIIKFCRDTSQPDSLDVLLKKFDRRETEPTQLIDRKTMTITNQTSNILDQLTKTIVRGVNFLSPGFFAQSEDQKNTFATLFFKPIQWKSTKACIIMIHNSPKRILNNQLTSYVQHSLKQISMQLMTQLHNDFIKWDNLREINIIKESDLKLLSGSIIEQNLISNVLQMLDLERIDQMDDYPTINFNFRNFLVQRIEIFAVKYLEMFNIIDLYFEESIPNEMKGEVGHFAILMCSILECIGQCPLTNKQKQDLVIHCDLDKILQNKESYVIRFQFTWKKQQQLLDKLIQSYLCGDYFDTETSLNDPEFQQMMQQKPMILHYINAIKKIIKNYPNYEMKYETEKDQCELLLFMQFRVFEQKHQYKKSLMDSKTDDSQAKYIYNLPQLKMTVGKEQITNHHYVWKPVPQQKAMVIKEIKENVQKQSRSNPSFARIIGANPPNKPLTKSKEHISGGQQSSSKTVANSDEIKPKQSDKDISLPRPPSANQSTKQLKRRLSKANAINKFIFDKQIKESLMSRSSELVSKLSNLLRQIVVKKNALDGMSFSVIESSESEREQQDENEFHEQKRERTTVSEQGNSPVLAKLVEFKSPQITPNKKFQRPNRSKYYDNFVQRRLVNINDVDHQRDMIKVMKNEQVHRCRHNRHTTTLLKNPSVQRNFHDLKLKEIHTKKSQLKPESKDLTEFINSDRQQTQFRSWTYRDESFDIEPETKGPVMGLLNSQQYVQLFEQIREKRFNSNVQNFSDLRNFMIHYKSIRQKGQIPEKIFLEMFTDQVQHQVEVLIFLNNIETRIHNRSKFICLCDKTVVKKIEKVAQYLMRPVSTETLIKQIME